MIITISGQLRPEKSGDAKKRLKERQKQARSSTTDIESRRMKMANGSFDPAYIVQFVTTQKAEQSLRGM
jgi:cellobiose-specific phosphotransferase system component IIA